MLSPIVSFIRNRWHPLWRLRHSSAFRDFQGKFDLTVCTRIPETDIKVSVKLLRDASWILAPSSLEAEVRSAFTLVLDLLNPAVFWDVGANIGFYSWFVRRHPSVQKVLMFEPDPVNFALLESTIRNNELADCEAKNLALSDSVGEASFLLDRASGAGGSLMSVSRFDRNRKIRSAYSLNETVTCRTATADGPIAAGMLPPSLMKIDVEGT